MDAWQKRFSQALTDAIEAQIVDLTDKLITVKAADYADYCGRREHILGLKEALDEARELEKNMDRPEQREARSAANLHYES